MPKFYEYFDLKVHININSVTLHVLNFIAVVFSVILFKFNIIHAPWLTEQQPNLVRVSLVHERMNKYCGLPVVNSSHLKQMCNCEPLVLLQTKHMNKDSV